MFLLKLYGTVWSKSLDKHRYKVSILIFTSWNASFQHQQHAMLYSSAWEMNYHQQKGVDTTERDSHWDCQTCCSSESPADDMLCLQESVGVDVAATKQDQRTLSDAQDVVATSYNCTNVVIKLQNDVRGWTSTSLQWRCDSTKWFVIVFHRLPTFICT